MKMSKDFSTSCDGMCTAIHLVVGVQWAKYPMHKPAITWPARDTLAVSKLV